VDISKFRNIAILNLHHIGDAVCTTPLIRYVHKHAPSAKITCFLGPINGCLAPFIPDCDQVVIVPAYLTACSGPKYSALFKYGFRFRHQFDLAICGAEPRKSLHVFLKLLDPDVSVAYVENNWHGRMINNGISYNEKLQRGRHNALEVLNIVAPYVELPKDLLPKLIIPPTIRKQYEPDLAVRLKSLRDKSKKVILISVTNNRSFCTIAVDDYASYLNGLMSKHIRDFSVVISYMKKDEDKAQQLTKLLKMPCLPILSKDFNEFMLLLDNVDMCFVGEGGVMNLAAALDRPQLALFGKTSSIEWHPLNAKARYLSHSEHVKHIPKADIMGELEYLLQTAVD